MPAPTLAPDDGRGRGRGWWVLAGVTPASSVRSRLPRWLRRLVPAGASWITGERRTAPFQRRAAVRGGSLQPGVGLAERVQPAGGRAQAAAHSAAVVRLPEAVAHGELAPVVGVHVLLELVRAEQRGGGADLVDPLGPVRRPGLPPRGQPRLLQQPHG